VEIRRRISIMPETPGLYLRLTVAENLEFFADLYGVPRTHDRINRVLQAVHLTERAQDPCGTLSKGLRQRVAGGRQLHPPDRFAGRRIRNLAEPVARQGRLGYNSGVTVNRAVPNIRADRPTETRDFFVDLLGFEVAMDLGWVMTVASPTNPSAQVTIVTGDDMAAPGISVEVADVDAVHAKAVEQGFEIAYPIRDEEWGVRRFMLREPSGTIVNVLSHRSR
jgi:catechol 2,3-dioxygenase-like lactoylglutathione lyase family enzyme